MNYTNELTITMETKEMATKAFEILVDRMAAGFECDKEYRTIPSMRMAKDLEIKNNTVILPEGNGYYMPEDAEKVFTEIIRELAATLNEEFTCEIYNSGDYSEGGLESHFEKGILRTESTFYPCGYTEYLCCDECGEEIVRIDEYEVGKKYYCSECDEEIDLSEQYAEVKPIITVEEIIIK